MHFDEFFAEKPAGPPLNGLPQVPERSLRMDVIRELANGPLPNDDALATAIEFTRLVRTEYELFGTSGDQLLSDAESSEALRALRNVLKRQGIDFSAPWSDFSSFRVYWLSHEGYGSWMARREMVGQVFGPPLKALEEIEMQARSNRLAMPVSPRDRLGWPAVDEYIDQLRERFGSATTTADYKDVGNRCVGVLEAISKTVYNPIFHCPPGEKEPPVDKTDIRIGAYIDHRLQGSSNAELRGLVKKASTLAHKMKHSPKADRTTTGISADSVILLANILRRLQE